MALEGMIHPVHEMRRPARVGLDADDLQLRITLEHSTENERTDDVLIASYDRHERVDLRSARGARDAFVRGQDVETQRHLLFDRRLPEVIVDWAVVILFDWEPRHHHAAQALRLDAIEVLDALLGRAHRGLSQP